MAGISQIHKGIAVAVARRPWLVLMTTFSVTLALSAVGIIVGEFSVAADNAGWTSRGTEYGNRYSQWLLAQIYLRPGSVQDPEVWDDLAENVQPGWEVEAEEERRRLVDTSAVQVDGPKTRNLQDVDLSSLNTGVLEGCDPTWYLSEMLNGSNRLWPVWKPNEDMSSSVLLSADALRDICLAEEVTQKVLEKNGQCELCSGADEETKCLPPFSLVLFARSQVEGGFGLECAELASEWIKYTEATPTLQQNLIDCVLAISEDPDYQPSEAAFDLPDVCPPFFLPLLIDIGFRETGTLSYTSSIFAVNADRSNILSSDFSRDLYELLPEFSRGTDLIEGAYDTQNENFNEILVDDAVITDMTLALASAGITMTAVLIHTRSIWLTVIGFFQIILSFPLSFFVYKFVGGITFFPFLNFIGVFILFALGADVIFVAVDKWKNARIDLSDEADITEVAAEALPDAAGAMLLTTFTTAVAFFATAICPVAPIKCFAIFCGLLISFDYILCCAFIFPALCIYDRNRNCCFSFSRRSVPEDTDDLDEKPSLIRRVLSTYHTFIHAIRFPLFVIVLVAFGGAAYMTSRLELPTSADVRLLRETHEFEKNYFWRRDLVYAELSRPAGGSAYMVFGLTPADTGDHLDPTTFTQLVLNEDFDPSKAESQLYQRDFCTKLVAEEFATRSDNSVGGTCPFERFDTWLSSNSSESFSSLCGDVTGLPVPEDLFHSCATAYVEATGDKSWYIRDGVVKIIEFEFGTLVSWLSSFEQLDSNSTAIEEFIQKEIAESAPESATDFYFTSLDFWWHDTNSALLGTAYIASAIALGTSAAVILFSSRSVVLTLFSAFSIAFVLASVVATLVLLGWTLGFLESICLAVVIGLSADFVIHFSHAYIALPGIVDRSARTKYAIIRMGPSILAAAFTTVCAAVVMLFCTVTFFTKFATILLVTISAATIASFVVFVVLMDLFGPSQPSYFIDKMFPKKVDEDVVKSESAKAKPSGDVIGVKKTKAYEHPFEHDGFEQEMEFYDETFA